MRGEWRDSTYAEYVKAPLENCVPLNEKRLTASPAEGGLGYDIPHLAYFAALMVPYGGLRDVNLQAGETVVIAPATGGFGGAVVLVALAMGARVIAMGRKLESLAKLKKISDRVETVQITGNLEGETAALARFGRWMHILTYHLLKLPIRLM
jgi:NADPH:quinone reductase-like Zn-dependent oxidoreductase